VGAIWSPTFQKDAAGLVELYQTASGEKNTRRAYSFSFQDEVIGDQLVSRFYALQSGYNFEHAIFIGASPEACGFDAAGVEARVRQLVMEVLEQETGFGGTHQCSSVYVFFSGLLTPRAGSIKWNTESMGIARKRELFLFFLAW